MQSPSLHGFRLSHQQRRWWLRHRDEPVRRALCAVDLTGELDPGRLQSALFALVRRHEILRTSFQRRAGLAVPIQVIAEPPSPPAWEEIDLSGCSAQERDGRLAELWQAAGEEAPDAASSGTALRARLIRLEPGLHRLILSLPALCADARTLPLLAGEIALAAEPPRDEDEEVLQYVQVSEWQHETVADEEEAAEGKAFWRDREVAVAEPLHLPWQRDAAAGGLPPEPVRISFTLGAAVTEGLCRLAAERSASLEAVLLTAWAALLGRLTGRMDLVLAVETDGRGLEELAGALGPLARTVPVRLRLDPASSFAAALTVTAMAHREAMDWQQHWLPDLQGDRTTRDIGFAFEPLPAPRSAGGVELRVTRCEAPGDLRPLSLRCTAVEDHVTAVLEADPERFAAADVAQLAASCRALVESAAQQPGSRLHLLPVLPADERERLLDGFNASASPVSGPLLVHRRFELQAEQLPGREALRCEADSLTYAELNARANRLARHLLGLGVGSESVVALWLPRSPDLVVSLLAVLKAGGAYLPVDITQPGERLARMLVDSGASLLVTRGEAEALPVPGLRIVDLAREEAAVAALDGGDLDVPVDPDGLAYVIFTSGSTGRPKGVAVPHRQLASYVHGLGERLGLGGCTSFGGASFATVSTFAADLGNTSLFGALCGGGCLHVLAEERIFDGEAMAAYFASCEVDVLKIVPSHFQTLYRSCLHPGRLLPRRCLMLGGEAFSGELAAQLLREAPHLDVLNHYGPTETTVGVCTHRPQPSGGPPAATVPIGRPLANARLYVLDGHLEPLPARVPGELLIGGAGVARGYLGQAAQTAERFLPDPFAGLPGARMYRTGDRARHLPGGALECLGRLDRQVKIRGFRVEPDEVALVLREHPGVEAAVVVPFEEAGGGLRLAAYTVPRDTRALDAAQLREWLSRRLPEPMCPVYHVFLKALPLTRNGKVDLQALPAPGKASTSRGEGYVAPRNPVEQQIAALWAEVLGLERVGIHDNYFEIGGDSMQSIRVIARAARAGLHLTAQSFFEHQTVALLAAALGDPGTASSEPAGREVPLTPFQRRFLAVADDAQTWGLRLPLAARGAVDCERLTRAWREVAARHDALRLRVVPEASGWRQLYAGDAEAALEWLDLSGVPAGAVDESFSAAAARLRAGLDLQRGPVVRLACLDFGPRRPARLLLACHPLVADEPSWRILVEDLGAVYQALEQGRDASLPAATRPFRSWAEELTARAGAPTAGAESVPVPTGAGLADPVLVRLERDETQALIRDLAGGARAEAEEVLLLALAEAWGEQNHGAPLVFDLESDGRRADPGDGDVSRTVGCFTTVSPRCLAPLPPTAPAGDRLRAAKEEIRAAPRQGIRGLAAARLAFRYLGNLDDWAAGVLPFALRPDGEALRLLRRCSSPHPYRIGVHAWIADGRLHAACTPGPSAAPHEAVELADGFVSRLRALLSAGAGAGATSPTDFPLAGLSQEDLQRIASLFGRAG